MDRKLEGWAEKPDSKAHGNSVPRVKRPEVRLNSCPINTAPEVKGVDFVIPIPTALMVFELGPGLSNLLWIGEFNR